MSAHEWRWIDVDQVVSNPVAVELEDVGEWDRHLGTVVPAIGDFAPAYQGVVAFPCFDNPVLQSGYGTEEALYVVSNRLTAFHRLLAAVAENRVFGQV